MVSRDLVRQGLMVFAIGLAIHAQLTVHENPRDTVSWLVLAIMVVLAAAAAGLRPQLPAMVSGAAVGGASPLQRLLLGAVAIGAIAATTYLATTQQRPLGALALWLAAALLASLAVRGWQVSPAQRAAPPWSAREVGLLVAIVVIAALLRFLWIGSLPRTYFGDEPRVGMFLHQAFDGGGIPNFFRMGWNTWPVLGLSMQGLFAPLFGLSIWSLRLSSALMGTLAVLATYLLARELFTVRAALFAAVLFAVCRTAIDFSRLGIAHAQVIFLEPLAFFFLWRALNGGRAVAYLWAGVTTAWCLYTYNAGQLVPPLVFGWLGLAAVLRPSQVRTHWRGVALLTAAFALTLFPYLYYFTDAFSFDRNWGQWTIMARNRQTMSEVADAWRTTGLAPAWEILSRQVWLTWLGFGVLPGGSYGLGYRRGGMLDDISAALFALGLGMSIRRLRNGRDAFVPYWWLATVLAGGIATIDPPAVVRMVGLLPAIAILAALPLEWLSRRTAGFAAQAVASVLAIGLVAGAAWDNYRTYFISMAAASADSMSELARYVGSLPEDHRVALLGPEHFLQFRGELFSIEFPGRWRDVAEPSHFLPLHEPLDGPLAVVLGPTQTSQSDYLLSLYPHSSITDVVNSDGQQLLFRAVALTPEDVRARTCLALAAQRADGSTTQLGCVDPFAERVDAPPDTARLVWTGSLYWPNYVSLGVTVEAAQHTAVTIDAQPPIVSDGSKTTTAMKLPRGWQSVRIEETAAPQRRLTIALASEPQSRWSFRPESGEGLNATYARQDGTHLQAVDPQLNAFAVEDRFPPESELLVRMPFTATWRGALRIDDAGLYQFEALGSGPYSVRIDGTKLVESAPTMPEQPALARSVRMLSAGLHPIEVDFDSTKKAHTTRRVFQLFWTPPGGTKQLIPPTSFVRN